MPGINFSTSSNTVRNEKFYAELSFAIVLSLIVAHMMVKVVDRLVNHYEIGTFSYFMIALSLLFLSIFFLSKVFGDNNKSNVENTENENMMDKIIKRLHMLVLFDFF